MIRKFLLLFKLKKQLLRQKRLFKKNGWVAHYIPAGEDTPFGVNHHTHGFETKYNHADIQITFPVPINIANGIFWNIADLIESGTIIEPGKMYSNIINNFDVQFIEAYESGRKVLRLIVPDMNGKFDTHPYKKQFENILHAFNNDNQD